MRVSMESPITASARTQVTRRGRTVALALVLSIAVFAGAGALASAESRGGVPEGFEVHDDETVYVVADATGVPRDVVVVDWMRIEGSGSLTLLDPGPVIAAEALKDDLEPRITPDGVEWTLDVDGRRDFFYRAESDRELPIEIEAAYFLDDRRVQPGELAGATGLVRIEVTVTNTLTINEPVTYIDADGATRSEDAEYWVPMLAPVVIDVDGTRFRDIEADAEIMTVTGSTVSHTFMTFPQPEETIVIEMHGTDIAIEPIIVSVFPKMAGSPDFSMAEQLAELRDGLDGLAELSEAHRTILGEVADGLDPEAFAGVRDLGAGFDQLAAGTREMERGAADLAVLVSGQIAYLDGIIGGIRGQDYSEVAQVPQAIGALGEGVREASEGVSGLVALLDGQIAYLDAIALSNTALEAQAWSLVDASAESTATVEAAIELATGLTTQGLMIGALRDGNEALGMPYGLVDTRDSLAEIAEGLEQMADALDELARGAAPLAGLPGQFEELASALSVLRNGGLVGGERLPGLVNTRNGLRDLAGGIGAVGGGISEAAESLGPLEELPAMLGRLRSTLVALRDGGSIEGAEVPGISATVEGLAGMSDGLAEGIDESNLGEAVVERMEDAAAAYDTFLGKPEGATGSVRFVFKLDGVSTNE